MKESKLVITIDDSSIDSVIEKVRLLKDELASLGLSVNLAGAVSASFQPEKEAAQDLWSCWVRELDASIIRAYSELTELLNMRLRATSSA